MEIFIELEHKEEGIKKRKRKRRGKIKIVRAKERRIHGSNEGDSRVGRREKKRHRGQMGKFNEIYTEDGKRAKNNRREGGKQRVRGIEVDKEVREHKKRTWKALKKMCEG